MISLLMMNYSTNNRDDGEFNDDYFKKYIRYSLLKQEKDERILKDQRKVVSQYESSDVSKIVEELFCQENQDTMLIQFITPFNFKCNVQTSASLSQETQLIFPMEYQNEKINFLHKPDFKSNNYNNNNQLTLNIKQYSMYNNLLLQKQEKQFESRPEYHQHLTTPKMKTSELSYSLRKKHKLNEDETQYEIQSSYFKNKQEIKSAEKNANKKASIKLAKKQRIDDALIYAINHIIGQAEKHDVFSKDYAYFLVMSIHGIAFNLTFYVQGSQQTYLFKLLTTICKKLMQISKRKDQQIKEKEIMKYVSNCLQYPKYIMENREFYLQELSRFIAENKGVMNIYMPLYCAYFNFIAHFKSVLQKNASLSEVLKHFKKIELDILKKYSAEEK